jgi:hypothetical protein
VSPNRTKTRIGSQEVWLSPGSAVNCQQTEKRKHDIGTTTPEIREPAKVLFEGL